MKNTLIIILIALSSYLTTKYFRDMNMVTTYYSQLTDEFASLDDYLSSVEDTVKLEEQLIDSLTKSNSKLQKKLGYIEILWELQKIQIANLEKKK